MILKRRKITMNKRDRLLLIIDGSNLAHRAYIKFDKLKSRKGVRTGMIYGFIRLLQQYTFRFKPGYLVVAFDTHESKESNFKKKLLEGYKAHREKKITIDYEDFNRQLRVIKRVLKYMGIPTIWDSVGLGHEADDYIGKLAANHRGKSIIISSDKDFCQLLILDRIKVFNPAKEGMIHKRNCREVMGYSPEETVDWLCLVGDTSDDIPGYRGIGPVKAREFLNKYGSVKSFLDSDAEEKNIEKEAMRLTYDRNVLLISFKEGMKRYPITKFPMQETKGMDEDKLRKIFTKYTLMSFLVPEFLQPFYTLKKYNPYKYANRKPNI